MLKFITSMGPLFMLWFILMSGVARVLPAPYAEMLLDNKWAFLIFSTLLMANFLTADPKERRQEYENNIQKKNFEKDLQQYETTEFIKKSNFKKKELALKVDWTPLASGDANFKTKKLVKVNVDRVEIIPSIGSYLFSSVFILIGVVLTAVFGYLAFKNKGVINSEIILATNIGLLFLVAGIVMLYFPRPCVFDKQKGWFWAGKKSLYLERDFMQLEKSARLSEIAAIQILSKDVSVDNSSYTSWEINLVYKDTQRLNIMDFFNKNSIIEDTQLLSDFLGVPVWDNT